MRGKKMKRKIITLFLVTAVAASTVMGCGNEAAEEAKATTEESTAIESTEAETAETETTEVESTEDETTEVAEPTEESAEDKPSDDDLYSDMETKTYTFDGHTAKVYSDCYTLKEDETKAMFVNCTIGENGYMGSFSFIGPKELKNFLCADNSYTQFAFNNTSNNENSDMVLHFYGTPSTKEEIDEMLAMDKSTIVSFANPERPYPENGYYNRELTDDCATWKFAIENDSRKGYSLYKLRLSDGACYQFEYTESKTIYDENRVNDLLDSIQFENYTEADWENKQ